MKMFHIVSKIKTLKIHLSKDALVHLGFDSLLVQFNQFKVGYNYQKEKWSLNELISFCVQEEERLESTSKDNGK